MNYQKNIKRTFIIGDEWIYYKFYCGPKTGDLVLTEIIKPVVEDLLSKNFIDKWFFIRYSDPDLHLRVRFHYTNPVNIFHIINSLKKRSKTFIDQNLIWKIQIDTYKREIERYGLDIIELSEELFYHESMLIVNMLSMIEGDDGEIIRWLFSLRSIDNLLDDFLYTEEEKIKLMEVLKTNFGLEFGMRKELKHQLDRKFRKERETINNIMEKRKDESREILQLIKLLDKKSENIKSIIKEILNLKNIDGLQGSLNDLMASYIHMLMNRLFKSKQRMHEMVIYDFLFRYYKSMRARKEKYKQRKTVLT